jgi:hypothetical protein
LSPQGWPRERRLHPGWSLWPGWWPCVAVILQPLDRDYRHVVGPGFECLSPFCVDPLDRASLRRASSDSALAPASGHLHLDTLVPASWRMGPSRPHHHLQHHGDDPTLVRLGGRLWCVLPHHLQQGHIIPLIPPPSLPSLLDRRWKRLLCRSPQ